MEEIVSSQIVRLPGNHENISIQEKTLREQLHSEIESKSKTCSNATFECSLPRVEGSEFCLRHILRDPRSMFRQCSFIYPNGKKCINAVQKHDTKKDPALTTLCFEHNRQMQVNKTRNHVGKMRRVDTNESLLNNLAQHLNIENNIDKQKLNDVDEEIDVVSPSVPPFVNYNQIHDLKTINNAVKKRKRILDYASDSSSGEEMVSMSNTAKNNEWIDSDNESAGSLEDDLTRHAGIYTRQEALHISENKLTKLQGLYIDQINRLHYILKEKRRQYLHDIRKEREILCSIHDQLKDTPHERIMYEKLKALNHYHRRHGVEAVLYKKFKEKRARCIEGAHPVKNIFVKCIYTEGGVKCGEKALPCCKYCRKHILEDKKQILFRACQVEKSGVICQETIPCIFDDSTCILHLELPQQRQYIQKKYDSETEEDYLDVSGSIHNNSQISKQQQEQDEINHINDHRVKSKRSQKTAIISKKETSRGLTTTSGIETAGSVVSAGSVTVEMTGSDDIVDKNITIAHETCALMEEEN